VPEVFCDPVQIEQVVLNLLSNSAYEMKKEKASQHPPKIFLSLYRKGDMAVMEVKDNGPGMAEDIKKRVFEPFFTTKSVGVGTGLGLSVSYFIITQNHKGMISVDSEPGEGTTFTIQLPINPESNGKKYGP
jgi:signal transduction histidine kinase